jgi:hypothetical protein
MNDRIQAQDKEDLPYTLHLDDRPPWIMFCHEDNRGLERNAPYHGHSERILLGAPSEHIRRVKKSIK